MAAATLCHFAASRLAALPGVVKIGSPRSARPIGAIKPLLFHNATVAKMKP
jgi:hypothetical protein